MLAESRLYGHGSHELAAVVLGLAVAAAVATRRRVPVLALIATLAVLLIALPITHSTHATLAIAMLSAATVAYQGRRGVTVIVGSALVPVVGLAWRIAGADDGGSDFLVYLVFLLAAVAAGDAVKSRHDAATARSDREQVARQAVAREMFDQYRIELGRELHDSLAHTLVAITTRAGVASHLHGAHGEPELISALEDVKHVSAEALEQLRATLQSVRDIGRPPLVVPAQTSRRALEDLIKPLELAGVRVVLDCEPAADEAPAPIRHAGFRIVQESLTNVLRHAQARSVSVSLSVHDHRLYVEVTNDGPLPVPAQALGPAPDYAPDYARGHAPSHAPGYAPSHGLLGMQERAHEVGGTVSAGPRHRGGWRVQAELPMATGTVAL